jgi:hypothetical protein
MLKWNDYLLELEYKKWETLSESSNEGLNSLSDRIENFINKEYEIDTEKFEEVVLNLFKRFKDKVKVLSIIATILLSSYMGVNKLNDIIIKAGIDSQQRKDIIQKVKPIENEINSFLKALAEKESSSNPKAVNRFGYIGKYQFGKSALQDLALNHKIDIHKFRKNPAIFPEKMQDKSMIKLLRLNKQYLGDYIDNFEGKIISGVKITKSGLLAGSHLVGASAVKKFLDSNGVIIPKDGNGVPVTEYIKKFGGYNLF